MKHFEFVVRKRPRTQPQRAGIALAACLQTLAAYGNNPDLPPSRQHSGGIVSAGRIDEWCRLKREHA